MIINNYQVMQRIEDLKELDLTADMLLDIQRRITRGTLDDEGEAGRFRTDADEIVVSDRLTGEISFTPPQEKEMHLELKRLIAFANAAEEPNGEFLHPFIKATILHFWVAYLHPFPDGNGRTARAIFYWYLMKKGYWLLQYLAVSRIIKTSKKKYDEAFLHTEIDDNDFTYFLLYMAQVTTRAISELMEYYEKKVKELEANRKIAHVHGDLNERQVALVRYFLAKPNEVTDIRKHQSKHGVVYQTARNDLLTLAEKGLVTEIRSRRPHAFVPNINELKKLMRS